jgi:hypothetical protein
MRIINAHVGRPWVIFSPEAVFQVSFSNEDNNLSHHALVAEKNFHTSLYEKIQF